MALLLSSSTPSLTSLRSSSSSKSSTPRVSTLTISANFSFRFHKQTITLGPKLFNGLQVHKSFILKQRGSVIVKASSDVDGASPDGAEPPTESEDEDEEEAVPLENLPLESKLQLKLEQKMRMKLAKKIRLRRKRLLRKRRLRKKGRWPPSKMKKNKNV